MDDALGLLHVRWRALDPGLSGILPKVQPAAKTALLPLLLSLRKNGLLVPWGYYTTHEPDEVTREDYLASRYIQEPLRMLDCDRPVNGAGAYLITSSERASHMRQAPVYVLNHTQFRAKSRGQMPGLAEMEVWSKVQADMM